MLNTFLIRAAAFAVLSLAPFAASAQGGVFKCVGPDGRTSFSGTPCEGGQRQDTVRAVTPGTGANWRAVCAEVRPGDQTGRAGYCRGFELCEQTKDPLVCEFFCTAEAVALFPAAGFGPTSAACHSHNTLKRGSNWVQIQQISPARDRSEAFATDIFRFRCLNAGGQADLTRVRSLACLAGTTNCVPDDADTVQVKANPQPVEKVASGVCVHFRVR
jgi:Domain of unknown function (DUF4124)